MTFVRPRSVLRIIPLLGLLLGHGLPSMAAPGSGSIWILTTPQGAELPAGATVEGFPLLVRLHGDTFRFGDARADGSDLRFTTAEGTPLAHQIEEWEPAKQRASIWVRIPVIHGDTRQEIRIHWGADTGSTSGTGAVFDASNGYAGVWHLDSTSLDAITGTNARDTGTTAIPGVIGLARRFDGNHGLACGVTFTNYPTGSNPNSTEAWIRPRRPNSTIVGWGEEKAQGKVVMQFRSPPHLRIDAYFSDATQDGKSSLPLSEWTHVLHTYERGVSRLYVNGRLDNESRSRATPLKLPAPTRVWIGGWYDNFDFEGDIDEVRVSRVARTPEWARLQFENQKPHQTLVGPVVPPGNAFRVSAKKLVIREGTEGTVSAEAGGAIKLSWVLIRDGRESVVAVDQLHCTIPAGRISGTTRAVLRLVAVYPDTVRSADVALTLRESIPDPVFTLQAPTHWNGRTPIEIVPRIANRRRLASSKAPAIESSWKVRDLATTRETLPDRIRLLRTERGGVLTVSATLHNGGQPVTQTCTIQVAEPTPDPWITRTPEPTEFPVDNQFYARDPSGFGAVHWTGQLTNRADQVFVRVADDVGGSLEATASPDASGHFRVSVPIRAGLVRHRIELGLRTAGHDHVLRTATNVICGDAFIIQGQSNAVATDWGSEEPAFRSPWIRTFGSMSGDPNGLRLWGDAVPRDHHGERLQIGYWGMEFARRLVESNSIPVCILNGAVGGTRIDQHQRNPSNPADTTTIYGRSLWRAQQARLTHGIRGVFWHQGENDQGADGPTGGYGWETYRDLFIDLAAAWKHDYPNIAHYHVFQIWPKSCAMGIDGSDNRLREVQRTLGTGFNNLHVLSTLGIEPPGGCHYPAAGYAEFARMLLPLVQRDHYGVRFDHPITPPNLLEARFVSAERRQVVLTFDQPVHWSANLTNEFRMSPGKSRVIAGHSEGNQLVLDLDTAADALHPSITYLDSANWTQSRLLKGQNGLAALTFCEVPVKN